MKKYILFFIFMFVASYLSGCSSVPTSKVSSRVVQPAVLTQDEENIRKLLDLNPQAYIFDFQVDKPLQSADISVYRLQNGNWELLMSDNNLFTQDLQGRFAFSFDPLNLEFQVSTQSKYSNGTSRFCVDTPKDFTPTTQCSTALTTPTEIVYGKEIPLVLHVLTSKNSIVSYSIENFYTPEVYTRYDDEQVYAVTIMFHSRTNEEM